MHTRTLETWRHHHRFAVIRHQSERRTFYVLMVTAVTMAVEILAGTAFGSMALLADGWHMGTHVAAFLLTIFAYRYAQKHAEDPLFTFGAGKVSVLGGFASAIALAVVALVMAVGSVERLVHPQAIRFNEAIFVATMGLGINMLCALLLHEHQSDHAHGHTDHTHPQDTSHHHHHQDHNLKAAYFHVLADALTSVLAIIALIMAKFSGSSLIDPLVGIVGALIIARWAMSLIRETAPILLDGGRGNAEYLKTIREKIEADADNRISDLHLWRVGPDDYAVIIALVTHYPKPVEYYKTLLKDLGELSHITIEIHHCADHPCDMEKR